MSDTSAGSNITSSTAPTLAKPTIWQLLTEPQYIMAILVLIFAFSILVLYALGVAKDGDVKTAAVGFATYIISYFFGSSKGSAAKTDTLTDLAKKP